MRRARIAIAGTLAAALAAGGLAASSGADRPASPDAGAARPSKPGDGQGGFGARKVGNFSSPVYVTGPRGAGGRLFVVEQGGVIKVLGKGGRGRQHTFLDIHRKVQAGGEQGLLSVAFDPRFRRNGLFYVYYTRSGGDIVIEEYRRAGGRKRGMRARSGSGRKVLVVEHSENSNHNGGQLQFGPKGLLYIGTGDGGSGYDPPENAQNKSSLLGKLLRIDPHRKGTKRYTVPASNPFAGKGGGGRREVFSYGLRNPFRFSFDRRTRNLVIGDVGQDAWEEVDFETVRSARGANFGWDALEGTHRVTADASPIPKNPVPPIFEYSHGGGNCSITGGFVSRDRRIRSLWGRYLYADYCKGQIRSLVPTMKGAHGDSATGLPSSSGVSSFGEDAKGHLYWANVGTGAVYAIVPKGKKKG
jgi:glucose/arabinose dehydrogenase